MEESPDHAAKRIANKWAGAKGTPKFVMVQYHLRPSEQWRSKKLHNRILNHWDIYFLYELRTNSNPKHVPWWNELSLLTPTDMAKERVGRGHEDVLETAKYL